MLAQFTFLVLYLTCLCFKGLSLKTVTIMNETCCLLSEYSMEFLVDFIRNINISKIMH